MQPSCAICGNFKQNQTHHTSPRSITTSSPPIYIKNSKLFTHTQIYTCFFVANQSFICLIRASLFPRRAIYIIDRNSLSLPLFKIATTSGERDCLVLPCRCPLCTLCNGKGAIEETLCKPPPSRLCVAVWLSLESAGNNDDDDDVDEEDDDKQRRGLGQLLSPFENCYLQNRQRVRGDAVFFTDEKASL